MNKIDIPQHIGMAVDFAYYHYSRLHQQETFLPGYWEKLLGRSSHEYLSNMRKALEFALNTDDYCLSLVKSPHLERYPVEDIRLFLEKFYVFLTENLEEHGNS